MGGAWCEHNDYPETCPPCRRAAGVDPSLAHGLAIEDEVLDWQPMRELGWQPRIPLTQGIDQVVRWVFKNQWCLERRYEECPDSVYV